jgi:uncharacterized protein YcbK (DUF882 family)
VPGRRERITPHFSWSEFACHDGTPAPRSCAPQLELLCVRFLEPLRRSYGPVTIVSGYRHADYNRSIGGARESFHVWQRDRQGIAVDLACARGQPRHWFMTAEACGPGGLHAYSTWLHLDSRGSRARW